MSNAHGSPVVAVALRTGGTQEFLVGPSSSIAARHEAPSLQDPSPALDPDEALLVWQSQSTTSDIIMEMSAIRQAGGHPNVPETPILGDHLSADPLPEAPMTPPRSPVAWPREQSHAVRRRRSSPTPPHPWRTSVPVFALRVLTSLVIVPLVVAALVYWPDLAIVWLSLLLMCLCAYEYSWLAFRIHYQLLATYTYYELAAKPEPSQTNTQESSVDATGPWTQLRSTGADPNLPSQLPAAVAMGAGHIDAAPQAIDPGLMPPLQVLELADHGSIVARVAKRWFHGHEWFVMLLLAPLVTATWMGMMHGLVHGTGFPVVTESPATVVAGFKYSSWVGNFFLCVCALSTPTWRSLVSVVIQATVFFGILLNSLTCPEVADAHCDRPLLSSTELFACGMLGIVMLRSLTSTNPVDMVVATAVDFVGYVYVVGMLGAAVGLINHNDHKSVYAKVLLQLLVVLWCASLAASACNSFMKHFQYEHRRLLPPRFNVPLNIEAGFCALAVGMGVMVVVHKWMPLPTPLWINTGAAGIAILMSRLATLFQALLKKAAGVKYSSRLLPGFGGVLDVVGSLLFGVVVFSRLYVIAMA